MHDLLKDADKNLFGPGEQAEYYSRENEALRDSLYLEEEAKRAFTS